MKLQPESKKELTRIACGTTICTAVMWVIFAALHLVGWVKFDYTVVLGSLIGAAVAIGNFAGICLVCQKVIDEQDGLAQSDIAGFLQCQIGTASGVDHRCHRGTGVPAICRCSAPAFPARYDLLPANNRKVQASCTGRAFGGRLWRTTPNPHRSRKLNPVTKGVKRNKWN